MARRGGGPTAWSLGFFLAQSAVAIVWVPTFVFQPVGTSVDQDLIGIVVLTAIFLGPLAVTSGLVAGRTEDEPRRFRWLVGFGTAAAAAGWLIVAYAGDVFTCGGKGAAPSAADVVCASSLLERVAGVVMVEAAILGQWALARRQWYLGA